MLCIVSYGITIRVCNSITNHSWTLAKVKPVILLHGLFGNLSNWGHVAQEFSSTHRVIIPRMPFYLESNLPGKTR